MKKLLLLLFLVLFSLSFVQTSDANVFIQDMEASIDQDLQSGLTSGTIETGSGDSGDYELIFCGIDINGFSNTFNSPSPGSWDGIFDDTCIGPGCQIASWGRFANSSSSQETTCSWLNPSGAFVAGSVRYTGVDTSDPIIDATCAQVQGDNFVFPGLASEPGAQVIIVQFFLFQGIGAGATDLGDLIQLNSIIGSDTTSRGIPSGDIADAEFDEFNGVFFASQEVSDIFTLILLGISNLDQFGVGLEEIITPIDDIDDINAQICAVSIRMLPRSVPTMSEWGLIGFAAFAGLAGLFFLRRRQATA